MTSRATLIERARKVLASRQQATDFSTLILEHDQPEPDDQTHVFIVRLAAGVAKSRCVDRVE
jgi:hypothetical protein